MEFTKLIMVDIGLQKDKDKKLTTDRYVIGCDPFMNPQELLDRGINVFTVYDKVLMRNTVICETKKTFQEFADKILLNQVDAKSYKLSYKFITDAGRPKTIEQIRNRPQ